MKKFVGSVNGKEFSNIEDFNVAVKNAIESGETPMVIQSYYKECDCCDECSGSCGCECKCDEKHDVKDNPLDLEKIYLKRTSLKKDDGSYLIPSNIKDLFDNATNKGEIEKGLELKIAANKQDYLSCARQLKKLNNQILELQKKFDDVVKERDEASHQQNYYNQLLSILNGATEGVEDSDEKNDEAESKVFASDALKNSEAFNIICDVVKGFDKYLKDSGFWKK